MARGHERPPTWALITMTVVLVAIVAMTAFALNREAPSGGAAAAPADTEAPIEKGTGRTTILVVGDSYTAGSAQGGNGLASWVSIATRQLDADGYTVGVDVSASGGCGYVQRGPGGVVFLDLVDAKRELDYDLIVFFGSRNDTLQKGDVRAAATEAYNAARRNSPDAELLVIGPPWVAENPPDWIEGTRDAVAAAAADAEATFVDPLAEGWFTGDASRYIGTDNIQPTDAGHQYMAGLIVPHLEQAIDSLPAR